MARPRMRYALRTLVNEVAEVFPDAEFDIGGENALDVSHSVTFDDRVTEWVKEFSDILATDPRIESISMFQDRLTITIKNSNRLADDASDFGITAAADVYGFERPDRAYPQGYDVSNPAFPEAGVFILPQGLTFPTEGS